MQLRNILTSLATVACTLSIVSAIPAPDVSASPSVTVTGASATASSGSGSGSSTPTGPEPNFVNLDRHSDLTVSWIPSETFFDGYYTVFPLNVYSNHTVTGGYMETYTIWDDNSLTFSGRDDFCDLIGNDFNVPCPVEAGQSHQIGIEIPSSARKNPRSTHNTTVHGVYLNARNSFAESIFQLAVWASDAPMPSTLQMELWVLEHAFD